MENTTSSLICKVELAGVQHTNPPCPQLFAFSEAGDILGFSDHRKLKGSIFSNAVSWDTLSPTKFQFEIRLNQLPSEAAFFPILLRVAKAGEGNNLFSSAQLVQYSLTYKDSAAVSNPIFKTEAVSLAEDEGQLDWFVLGLLAKNNITSSILFRDVSSFPASKGDVESQLRDLIEGSVDDLNEGLGTKSEGWYPVPWEQNKEQVPTFAPVTPSFSSMAPGCHNCSILEAQLNAARKQMRPTHDDEELTKLRQKVSELKDKTLKQDILLEKLRKERREVLLNQLVGQDLDRSNSSGGSHQQDDELDESQARLEPRNLSVEMEQQETLIMSIKEQLLKLSSQIRLHGQQRIQTAMR